MAKYGLIGKNIGFSFSKAFFTTKFSQENRSDNYVNFDVESIDALKKIIRDNKTLKGLNITIPYKESVIPLLDRLDKEAKKIGKPSGKNLTQSDQRTKAIKKGMVFNN